MRGLHALFWIGVYLGLVLTPVVLLLLGTVPAGNGFWVDAGLAMGYAALTMVGVQFVLTARFRRASAPFGIDILYYFHRLMAVLAIVLMVAHAVIVLVAKPALASQIFSLRIPWHAVAALAALALFLVLVAASLWRKQFRIRYEPWRRWHGVLAGLAVVLAFVHVELAGYYIQVPWKHALWTVITATWVLLLLYVRLVKPLMLLRRPYTVTSVAPERGDAWTVTLQPEGHKGLRFLPGQFAWLTLGGSPFAVSEHPFSIAASAEAPAPLAFTIKELGDFTRTVRHIAPGTRAYVDGPYGAFSVDHFPDAPGFVFAAGGVGIAPIMSMLRTLAARGERRPLVLFYGNRTWDRVIFRDELAILERQLNLVVIHVLQEPTADWRGETGLFTQEILARHAPANIRQCICFVCGPKPMIAVVERAFNGLGVPLRNIQSELFDLV